MIVRHRHLRHHPLRRVLVTLSLLALAPIVAGATPSAAKTGPVPADGTASAGPAGFSDALVLSLPSPTAMAWTPDGRMLLTQDTGQVRVVRDGVLMPTPALALGARLCSDGARGLAGMTVDPEFATNHFVYLFWSHNRYNYCGTASSRTPRSRVTRYVLGDNDIIDPTSEKVLVDWIKSPESSHDAGDLHFGVDGLLYVSVGDGGCTIGDPTRCAALNTNSRRMDIANGKILRITRDGEIPASNPFASAAGARHCTDPVAVPTGSGPCTETFAAGFRNPYRFVQRPGTNNFLVNDVGEAHWEEINELVAGADYGWNAREGSCVTGSYTNCGPTSYTNPIFDYSHEDGCASITGGAFVPAGLWPAPYSGSYVFADFVCGGLFRLAPEVGGGYSQEPFFTSVANPTVLAFGPYGNSSALYYLNYFGGQLRRISYSSDANSAPVAGFSHRPAGLPVTLDGSASYDADTADAVQSWSWTFGDGTSATTTTPTVTHTYPRKQVFSATLRVTDSRGAVSAPLTQPVYAGEHAPVLTLSVPPAGARFSVGQVFPMSASASDVEDGALPATSITWTLLLNHNTHQHPFRGPVNAGSISTAYPKPEDVAAASTSYLIVTVAARDSRGLTTSAQFNLLPRKVGLTFATAPAGGSVVINDTSFVTPVTVTSWQDYVLLVSAPDQSIGGVPRTFRSWSDGGARSHTIATPASKATYTATFG